MSVAGALFLITVTFGSAQQLPVPMMGSREGRPESTIQPEQIDVPVSPRDVGGLSTQRRDPFWPVGYAPRKREKPLPFELSGTGSVKAPERAPEVKVVAWDQARARLDLRGVSSIGRDKTTGKPRFVAVMAGKLVEEGDTISIAFEGQVYRWKAVSVSAAGVQMVKLDVRAE